MGSAKVSSYFVSSLPICRYVHRPLLIRNKKYHFRCYSLLFGDMSAYVYSNAYILTAGIDYSCSMPTSANCNESLPSVFNAGNVDLRQHISNLSVNKHLPGHPGQIPCNLPSEYPQVSIYFLL